MQLLERQFGVRHRSRYVLTDSFNGLGLKDFSPRPIFGIQEEHLSVGILFILILAPSWSTG